MLNAMGTLTLYELNGIVREVLESTMDSTFWVTGEISACQKNATGHCYLELIQKNPFGGGVLARAKANIWRSNYPSVKAKFERETGKSLSVGLNVLMEVTVSFHEVYGYSLVVQDIDPAYTMGDMARRRREILARLEADGVMELNRELEIPLFPGRIAVISSESAAGYGDFCSQLANDRNGFRFGVTLFPAMMQGDKAEESVIAALDRIAEVRDDYDVVVIIRGGGAASELGCFDSYPLAFNVANFPLPVITGIGHERDDTVIDAVSHTRVKTPTAAAEFLLSRAADAAAMLDTLGHRMADSVRVRMDNARRAIENVAGRIPSLSVIVRMKNERAIDVLSERLSAASGHCLDEYRHRCETMSLRLDNAYSSYMAAARHRLELLSERIDTASPERIMRLGYAVVLVNGRLVKNVASVAAGDALTVRFADGEVESKVTKTSGYGERNEI